MIDRILEILRIKNLSPAQFADMIGVQRSSISHLISGRNKPSLEFLQKMLKAFPEINSDWMLSGKGEMLNGDQKTDTGADIVADIFTPGPQVKERAQPAAKEEVEKVLKRKWTGPGEKKIEKIVYFYTDNTFREYFPSEP